MMWPFCASRTKPPGTGMFPVVYNFYRPSSSVPGSLLVVLGCSQKLARALSEGIHESNPLLGGRLWKSWDDNFSLYASTDGQGHVFYRKLRRGEFDGIPAAVGLFEGGRRDGRFRQIRCNTTEFAKRRV